MFQNEKGIDRDTREIVGVFVGDRSRQSAQGLWNSLPPVYLKLYQTKVTSEARSCAVSYTVFPNFCHRAID